MRNVAAAAAALALIALTAWAAPKKDSDIPPGYRAVSVPLTGDQLAFLKIGDRVDLLATFDAVIADKSKEKVTATLLQNVLVRGVKAPAKLEDKGAVELVVNPNEAQYTALGLHQGALHLAVRGEGDVEMKPMEMASFRKLFR